MIMDANQKVGHLNLQSTQWIFLIEAHIFVSFLSYCLQVTLKQRAKAKAPGLTPRAILEKFKRIQMIDVHLPTPDGRNLTLSEQPPSRLEELKKKCSEDL